MRNATVKFAPGGVEVLNELGIPKHIADILAEIAREKIIIKGVTIHGFFEITSTDPRGIEMIKETLLSTKKIAKANDAEVDLYTVGAPTYRIEVTADDYKMAEAALEKIVEETRTTWLDQDGKFSFSRD